MIKKDSALTIKDWNMYDEVNMDKTSFFDWKYKDIFILHIKLNRNIC